MARDIMVDCETLGVVADAVIMSIGAVRFDIDSDEIDDAAFYASISIDSNLDFKRRVQESTVVWWMKQSAKAQEVFHEPKATLETALCEFSDWINETPGDKIMWSNGADFDIAMLAHAFTQATIDVPWLFWNSRCVRTYKNLPQAKNVKVERVGTHHNALSDAIHQAKQVQAIQRILTGKKAVTA